jgi:hypothetical protein
MQADQEWASALLKIKRKDPSIYDTSTQLFSEDTLAFGDGAPVGKAKQKRSPKTLRQLLYDQVSALTTYATIFSKSSSTLMPISLPCNFLPGSLPWEWQRAVHEPRLCRQWMSMRMPRRVTQSSTERLVCGKSAKAVLCTIANSRFCAPRCLTS